MFTALAVSAPAVTNDGTAATRRVNACAAFAFVAVPVAVMVHVQ